MPKCEHNHHGCLASQWVSENPSHWEVEYYDDFLSNRRHRLAESLNALLLELRSGNASDQSDLEQRGGVATGEEEAQLREVNAWLEERDLPEGTIGLEIGTSSDADVTLDIAWPDGLALELSEPVALLLDEPRAVIEAANRAGFRCYTDVGEFQAYVTDEFPSVEDAA